MAGCRSPTRSGRRAAGRRSRCAAPASPTPRSARPSASTDRSGPIPPPAPPTDAQEKPARMRLFGELTKIEDQPDGTLKVYGVASTGARDDAGEIVLPAAMQAALPAYARYPALREMHQPTAAGRTLEASVDDDGA